MPESVAHLLLESITEELIGAAAVTEVEHASIQCHDPQYL